MSAKAMIEHRPQVGYQPLVQWLYDVAWLLGDNNIDSLPYIAYEIDIATTQSTIPEDNKWVTDIISDTILEIETDLPLDTQ